MSVKRYKAVADNTITNAFESNLEFRATGSNIGASDRDWETLFPL